MSYILPRLLVLPLSTEFINLIPAQISNNCVSKSIVTIGSPPMSKYLKDVYQTNRLYIKYVLFTYSYKYTFRNTNSKKYDFCITKHWQKNYDKKRLDIINIAHVWPSLMC